jgi:hypothetical protein
MPEKHNTPRNCGAAKPRFYRAFLVPLPGFEAPWRRRCLRRYCWKSTVSWLCLDRPYRADNRRISRWSVARPCGAAAWLFARLGRESWEWSPSTGVLLSWRCDRVWADRAAIQFGPRESSAPRPPRSESDRADDARLSRVADRWVPTGDSDRRDRWRSPRVTRPHPAVSSTRAPVSCRRFAAPDQDVT